MEEEEEEEEEEERSTKRYALNQSVRVATKEPAKYTLRDPVHKSKSPASQNNSDASRTSG